MTTTLPFCSDSLNVRGQQRQLEVRRGLARQREAVQAGRFLDFPVRSPRFPRLFSWA
jgi:hypothetical protein